MDSKLIFGRNWSRNSYHCGRDCAGWYISISPYKCNSTGIREYDLTEKEIKDFNQGKKDVEDRDEFFEPY